MKLIKIIGFFSVLITCLIVIWCLVVLLGCGPLVKDEGIYQVEGEFVVPDRIPMNVLVEPSMEDLLDEAPTLAEEAINEWNAWAGFLVFERALIVGEVSVDFGITPPVQDEFGFSDTFGMSLLGIDDDLRITKCTVTVSNSIAYHAPTVRTTIEHELGHCLGLLDDPNSVELESVMSSSPANGYDLTAHDREALVSAYKEKGLLP